MAAAAPPPPLLLTLTSSLFLAVAVVVAVAGVVESYTDNPSSTAAATGPVDEHKYSPARLCDKAMYPESCVEVLRMIPGLAETPPDYDALAVLLDGHTWTTLQSAAGMHAAVSQASFIFRLYMCT
uniref:Pectinesterase inhibitor domain-containing protein n=1 Tax=Leersia perrieri TaxID=77586 RepID=A0A0D9XR22_9ORYZ